MHLRSWPILATVAVAMATSLATSGCVDLPPQPTQVTAPGTSGVATTKATSSARGIDELALALDLVDRNYPDATRAQVNCIGESLQRKPDLVAPARRHLEKTDLETRKRLFGMLADCIGPDVLEALYEQRHPVQATSRDCVRRSLALDRPLDQAVAIVAGEPDAERSFTDSLAAKCPGSSGTTSPAT